MAWRVAKERGVEQNGWEGIAGTVLVAKRRLQTWVPMKGAERACKHEKVPRYHAMDTRDGQVAPDVKMWLQMWLSRQRVKSSRPGPRAQREHALKVEMRHVTGQDGHVIIRTRTVAAAAEAAER